MALTIPTQDLVNYPGNTKNISVDQAKIVPIGYEGDELYVLSFSTTAYSDNTTRTTIPTRYVTETKAGWCKSSGFKGDGSGKFALNAAAYQLSISLDNTISGSDNSGYYTIALNYNADGTPLSGESVAADMETKINNLALVSADSGFTMAYKNCHVEFTNNKFWIVSGSIGRYFDGTSRSSVNIKAATTNDASVLLGFDLQVSSIVLSNTTIKEAPLSVNYTIGNTTLSAGTGLVVNIGDSLLITDGTNTDYFTALSGSTNTVINVPTTGVNGFNSIKNNYIANSAKIQILRYQDPDNEPNTFYTSIDSLMKQGVKYLMSQIDYSS